MEFARRAEELEYSSIWVGDHVCLPAEMRSAYPYGEDPEQYEVPADRPFLEALTTLGFVSGVTKSISLGISVAIVPYRHPLLWLKTLGTLQRLSNNRLVLGAGVGWLKEEFSALNADYEARGELTDETLDFLRRSWQQSPVSYSGRHIHVVGMHVVPPSLEESFPAIWIGGNGSLALKRTLRFGDVWHPHIRGCSPKAVEDGLRKLRHDAAAAGVGRRFGAALYVPVKLDAVAGRTPPWDAGAIVGPPEVLHHYIAEYSDAGVEHFILSFGGNLLTRIRTLERIADGLR